MSEAAEKWVFKILHRVCPDHLYEEIEGDLLQRFQRDLHMHGKQKAERKLVWNAIRFLRPGVLLRGRSRGSELMILDTISVNLKMGFRSVLKRKSQSFINVFGLSLALAACMIITKYVDFQLGFDNFHADVGNIYRINSSLYSDGDASEFTSYDLGPSLKSDFPEVLSYVRTHGTNASTISSTEGGSKKSFDEDKIILVDSTFLRVFTYEAVAGNLATALDKPSSVVITQSIAHKYFGEIDPIGKILSISSGWVTGDYTVTGIVSEVPDNSIIQFDFLFSIQNLLNGDFYRGAHLKWDNFNTYIKLNPGTNLGRLYAKFPGFIDKYRGNDPAINAQPLLELQPLREVHHLKTVSNGGVQKKTIYLLSLIGGFILAIACINYINLSTARIIERSQEVAVRKVLGAQRRQLIFQFLIEASITNFFSIAFALSITALCLPLLSEMVEHHFQIDFLNPLLWLAALGFFITATIFTGLYPALALSSLNAKEIVKGRQVRLHTGISFRNSLVVFQFAISLILIIGTYVIYNQVDFMRHYDPGMITDQMLVIRLPREVIQKNDPGKIISFKNDVSKIAAVQRAATSVTLPAQEIIMDIVMQKAGGDEVSKRNGEVIWVDLDFIPTYGLSLLAGSNWKSPTDKGIIVNETALTAYDLGSPEQALNERIIIGRDDTVTIRGVLKDFHWKSLHTGDVPIVFVPEEISRPLLSIHLTSGNNSHAVSQIRKEFDKHFSGQVFNYYFLSDALDSQYKADTQLGNLLSGFAILALSIACLGLWGQVSYATLSRAKEISIRKVLGASVRQMVELLSRQVIILFSVASAIAIPISLLASHLWLDNFAYKIELTPQIIIIPVLFLLIAAILTIGTQTIRAAMTNPVDNLKGE